MRMNCVSVHLLGRCEEVEERALCHLYLLGNSFNEFRVGIITGDRRQYATWVAWSGWETEDRQTGNVAKLTGKRETVQKSAV